MKHVDFFYDFSCPYAYLAHDRVDEVCARGGATVAWRPFLLGGVFRAIGTPDVPAAHMPASKARMNLLDMHRWAAFFGVPFRMPETHPNRTVLALRAVMAAGEGERVRASKALFAAYWAEGLDVSRAEVVSAALGGVGLDGAALVKRAEEAENKEALRRATDEAIAAGVFGAPAFVVTIRGEAGREDATELFWGQDRLVLVEAMLTGRRESGSLVAGRESGSPGAGQESGSPGAGQESGSLMGATESGSLARGAPSTVELHFDFSSPFAYLAAVRVREVAARAGAQVVYRPFLLGGLFKAVGTANVPLFEMPEAKRRHAVADMHRWAARFGAVLRFPTRFPMNTVKALRMVLALGEEERAAFVDAVFRAYWAEDRDISDDAVLAEIAGGVGVDGAALVARASEEGLKRALRDATEEVARRGVFGAPSFFVGDLLFWGQDRLEFVEKALGGWRPPGE